ncbi:hypothetical protein [Longispora albida]|uniref:hypothetical protein n=1 Tax=Longispora albida TaxID=203523 RepID=UPI00037F656B|nr:hypothetical protein [Longispora albida]
MSQISFHTDPGGFPRYQTDDERFIALGVWFSMELRNSPYQCLDLLALVDDVTSGREESGLWEGEAFLAEVTADGVKATNTILSGQSGVYTLDEVRRAAEDYWRFVSAQPHTATDLADWEQTWSRSHPYRGRLF